MIGTAWPSLSTSRSLAGFQTSFGSHRIWWYMRTVTRWASDSAVDGWPLPATVVISTDNLPISTALRWTAASKLMACSVGGDAIYRQIVSRATFPCPTTAAQRRKSSCAADLHDAPDGLHRATNSPSSLSGAKDLAGRSGHARCAGTVAYVDARSFGAQG